MTTRKNPLKTFEPNQHGRDFVIGDLHGCYGVLQNLLKSINFDETVDRMFSVGDLVDRGPHSKKCLGLLEKNWFHAVLANHEQLMHDCFHNRPMGQYWYQNGGTWGAEAVNDFRAMKRTGNPRAPTDENQEIIDMLALIEDLPYMMTINTKSGKKFHILHAELPQDEGKITDEMLADPETVEYLATRTGYDGQAFMWNRALFMDLYGCDLSNRDKVVHEVKNNKWATTVFNDELSHIISGHTIVRQPLTIVGQTNIDTCAFRSVYVPAPPYGRAIDPVPWAALTCVELDTWTFYQATESTFRQVDPFVITENDLV